MVSCHQYWWIKKYNSNNRKINKKYSFEILITTTTLSSSELAKEKLKNFSNVYHGFSL